MLLLAGLATAEAFPTYFSAPPPTLADGTTAGGGGFGYTYGEGAGGATLSGWVRTGVNDRLEAYGGAYLPFQPFQLGVHGGVRTSVGNAAGSDGVGASVGVAASDNLLSPVAGFAVGVPVSVGYQSRNLHGWIGAQADFYPSLLGLDLWTVGGVDFPIDVYTVGLLGGYDVTFRLPYAAVTLAYEL